MYAYIRSQVIDLIKINFYLLLLRSFRSFMDVIKFIEQAVESRASDIHFASGNKPAVRINGKIVYAQDEPPLTNYDVERIIEQIVEPEHYTKFLEKKDMDAAASLENIGRFRVNAFAQRNGASLVMRVIKNNIPPLESLNLPNSIKKIFSLQQGLVLVTGPTGSGKSTTLAAIINEINCTKNDHIITIEDPVEYIHPPKRCVVNQREIGADSKDYTTALRAALREDPDVILMGEIRDLESMTIALSAAETGHLIFSTLHTEGAAKTIDRLVDMFPVERQKQALNQISTTLKVVVSQRLLPRCDTKGRIGAFEIMFVTPAIGNLIREGKISQIDQIIQISQNLGMITKEKSIQYLLQNGYISQETADLYTFEVSDVETTTNTQPNMAGVNNNRVQMR